MGFARSGGEIYSRRKWQERMNEKNPPCRHEVMRGEGGLMVCQSCGFTRFPEPWEDAGNVEDLPIARAQTSSVTPDGVTPSPKGKAYLEELNIRVDGKDGDV